MITTGKKILIIKLRAKNVHESGHDSGLGAPNTNVLDPYYGRRGKIHI